jgi:uncharacterized membrane protein YphA (DoxX/SURF4 family)
MPHEYRSLTRTIALARVATAVFFLLFGEYKIFGSEFAHGGFQHHLQGYIDATSVAFYRPFLSNFILLHAVFFGYVVGLVELFIGLSLLFGLWVRAASVLGVLHMISLTLATWWAPGYNAPRWQYFGNELDHIPLIFLFMIFFAANAGQTWGLDGRFGKRISRM